MLKRLGFDDDGELHNWEGKGLKTMEGFRQWMQLGGRGVGGRGREESYIGSKHVCMGLHGGLHIRILKNHDFGDPSCRVIKNGRCRECKVELHSSAAAIEYSVFC